MKTSPSRPFPQRGLYVITDCFNLDTAGLLHKSNLILEAGICALQYRDKTPEFSIRRERALALQKLCARYDTVFLINDDVELAAVIAADGVHIGRDDASFEECRDRLGKGAIIGVSCYNQLQLALQAEKNGADYVAFGSFYPTLTKTALFRAAPELLTRAKHQITVPVVAIGGITPVNGAGLLEAGADILAVVSSVYSGDDPLLAVSEFKALFSKPWSL